MDTAKELLLLRPSHTTGRQTVHELGTVISLYINTSVVRVDIFLGSLCPLRFVELLFLN